MRIHDRVHLVGSGQFGFQLSDRFDCNIYLLDGGGEFALIDAGGGKDPERIVSNIQEHGVPMEKVTHLLLTHVHGDHAAGARYFRDAYGVKIMVSKEAAPWLEQGDMDKTSVNAAKKAGVYPADFQFPSCPVDQVVAEGDRLRIGEIELKVIETPGHSRGHVSYLMEQAGRKSLFAGDTIFANGKIVLQHIWDCNIQDYAQTVEKLNGLAIDRLFPGHGPFLLSEAWKHVDSADRCFKRLELPPNI